MNLPTATHLVGSIAFRTTDSLNNPVACDIEQLGWNVYDPGPASGAILVERFRTFDSRIVDLDTNKQRFIQGAKLFGFPLARICDSFEKLASFVVKENIKQIQLQGDVSVVLLYSPTVEGGWNAVAYLVPIPFQKIHYWYTVGASLYSSEIKVPTSDCMPNSIKHRSRLQYWLADREAQSRNRDGIALLETTSSTVADTSVANIVLVTVKGDWLTPAPHHAIHGSTLLRASRLLKQHDIKIASSKIDRKDLLEASEVLMLGSTGCIWNATSFNEKPLGANQDCPKTKWLQSLWRSWVGIDILEQAAARCDGS